MPTPRTHTPHKARAHKVAKDPGKNLGRTAKEPTPDALGRAKSSSSRQQVRKNQATQTGAPGIDRKHSAPPSKTIRARVDNERNRRTH
jgi:hypothetical protein